MHLLHGAPRNAAIRPTIPTTSSPTASSASRGCAREAGASSSTPCRSLRGAIETARNHVRDDARLRMIVARIVDEVIADGCDAVHYHVPHFKIASQFKPIEGPVA